MEDMTDQERRDTQKALMYDLRLLIKEAEKKDYTKEEILEFLLWCSPS